MCHDLHTVIITNFNVQNSITINITVSIIDIVNAVKAIVAFINRTVVSNQGFAPIWLDLIDKCSNLQYYYSYYYFTRLIAIKEFITTLSFNLNHFLFS